MTIELKTGDEQTATLYQAILDDISSGRLVGGQRLKISALADRFGVSASPVRETLRQMQGEGFVEIHPNRGATIKLADASTIQNIFEVLQLLEPYFVSWFAEHARPEDVARLSEIQEKIRTCGDGNMLKFRKLDLQFHSVICQHHYNDVAAETWKRLRTALNVHAAPLRISQGRLRNILKEHDDLIEAFRQNDPEQADRVIRTHVDGSFVQMSQQMRALGL
ncbi:MULTISPECIES: GntR family transcriptional regulator [unclassified Ruegeria]|uniref:GntR family transcriptional regulator n=1 Tax=unclassified Ruegeria TaxID=2625375 RepID=UPI0014892533|nr:MULTISPECIES: GntR family transcriptional regulator [unclassified Ruegeria]